MMCGGGYSRTVNTTTAKDYLRGRYLHSERFDRIIAYNKRRWTLSRDLTASARRLRLIQAAEQRRPK